MKPLSQAQFWFVTGSQNLYGPEVLAQVEKNSRQMVLEMDQDAVLPAPLIFKALVRSSEEILKVCQEANNDPQCAGLITWMHTFSPSKMWIAGLTRLAKPLFHLHTQFNRDLPWATIDMNFMNTNQSAHGDREYGFMISRLGIPCRIAVGHWQDPAVRQRLAAWMRAAAGVQASATVKVARFGDNMREVAVTEGDKVEAQIKLGWAVYGFGVGDLVQAVNAVAPAQVAKLIDEYRSLYTWTQGSDPAVLASIQEQAKYEIALKKFLEDGGFGAFTTTFEDLHGLAQLPGLAAQRLMAQGYGFAGEGDWKTAALLRLGKIMAHGMKGGTSFMEDYTYHLEAGKELVLGSHMLEICPSIADGKPAVEVHPLGIGGKADPARLVFAGATGPATLTTLVDMGTRFRMITNDVEVVSLPQPMPKLPVARVLWKPLPSLSKAGEAWIMAGGAHHNVFSHSLTAEHMKDWAEMMQVEFVHIGKNTDPDQIQKELRWNSLYYNK